jgi:hypothetical protein
MIGNGYGAKFIWYEMVSGYGTKLQFCGKKEKEKKKKKGGQHRVLSTSTCGFHVCRKLH